MHVIGDRLGIRVGEGVGLVPVGGVESLEPGELARVEPVAADLAHELEAHKGAHVAVTENGAEKIADLHGFPRRVAGHEGVLVFLAVELDRVVVRRSLDGEGVVLHPAEALKARRAVPDFVAVFDIHFQVGIQRRIDRAGLMAGVGVDAVAAVFDELGGLGDVVVVRVHGDIDPQVGVNFVAELDEMFHDMAPRSGVAVAVREFLAGGLAGVAALIPGHQRVFVGMDPVHEAHHLELVHDIEKPCGEDNRAVRRVAGAVEADVGDAGAGRVPGLALGFIKFQSAGTSGGVGQLDIRGGGVGSRIVNDIRHRAAEPHHADGRGLAGEDEVIRSGLVVFAEDDRAAVLHRPAVGVHDGGAVVPVVFLPGAGVFHDVHECVVALVVADEPDVDAQVMGGGVSRLLGKEKAARSDQRQERRQQTGAAEGMSG